MKKIMQTGSGFAGPRARRTWSQLVTAAALVAVVAAPSMIGCGGEGLDEETTAESTLAVTIGSGKLTMALNETVQVNATLSTASKTQLYTLKWASGNAAVATVSSSGVVTALASGSTTLTVTATLVDTGATATAQATIVVGGASTPTPPPTPTTPPPTTTPPSTVGGLLGYATVNGTTTGGQGGTTATVTTFAALKSAAESSATQIIKVSGSLTGTGLIRVQSNKSIIGMPGSVLVGASLFIYGKSNIIVQNMTIKNVVTYSNIIIKEGSHHVWVDHCDLSSTLVDDWDYYDGLLDVGTGADFVTVSWSKLHENHKAMLIGFSYTEPGEIDHLHVTVHHNLFSNISERLPSVRYGTVHAFNNYYLNNGGYVGSLMGATVRVENNYFKNTDLPIRTEISPVAGFISGLSTNVFDSSGSNKITTAPSSWVPTYKYLSAVDPVANVPAIVSAGAGATL